MPELPQHIQDAIETLCNDGCQSVRNYIQQLETGESLPITDTYTESEHKLLLNELKKIMAVYDED